MSDEEEYLTVEAAAHQLGLAVKTIKEYLNSGKLKGDRNPVNGSWVRIAKADIAEFLGRKVEPSTTKQSGGGQSSDNPEIIDAKKQTSIAEEQKKQAVAENEKHRAVVEKELRMRGFASIEAALKDVETKQQEAVEILEAANRERLTVQAELNAAIAEKQKAANTLAVLKERNSQVNLKWGEIVVTENKQKAFVLKYEGWRKDLQGLIKYHKENIIPCVAVLESVSRSIYKWMDILNSKSGYDFTVLYNYIGRVMVTIDQYIEKEGNINPPDIEPKDGKVGRETEPSAAEDEEEGTLVIDCEEE